ncbi:MAG: XRE family transcriptional regulator, partial [Gammaproteobacteria bacterium]|nr:XRE family transcriptional regulator [Gammaproteobacteria bacterium]
MDPIDSIERGRRIKILRVLANLDRKAVEEKHGINFNTLKGWELGRHGGLTEKGAKKIISMCQQEGV